MNYDVRTDVSGSVQYGLRGHAVVITGNMAREAKSQTGVGGAAAPAEDLPILGRQVLGIVLIKCSAPEYILATRDQWRISVWTK